MAEPTLEAGTKIVVDLAEKSIIKILHVDDEVGFLKTAKLLLEMHGDLEIDSVSSVEEAWKKLKEKRFDAIVSDYQMPGKDGLEFLKELRKKGNTTPFVIFTGKGRQEVAIEALNLGADRYLQKGGDPETVFVELVHCLKQIVRNAHAEGQLKRSEMKLRSLVENAGTGIASINIEGKFTLVNEALCNFVGYSKRELIGKPFVDFLHPDDKESILQLFISSGKNHDRKVTLDFRAIHKKGHIVYLHSSPILQKYQNEIVGFSAIITDITERKKTENLYRTVVELAPDSIITVDIKGKIISCNTAATRMLGFSKDEMVGRHFSKIGVIRMRDLPKFLKLFSSVLRGKISSPLELTFYRKDRTPLQAEVRVGLLKEGKKTIGIQAISRDLTERREVEREFKTLFNLMADPVVIVDRKGKFLEINDRAAQTIGYEKEELLGKNFMRTSITTAKSKAILAKNLAKRMMGMHVTPYEVTGVTKDGKKIPFEVNAIKIDYRGKPADIVIFRDISERKKMEEKLRVVGGLTRHDARNKLYTVTMNTYLLKQKIRDSEAQENLEDIETAINQIERIFEFARNYEKLGMEKLVYLNVEKNLKETLSLLSNLEELDVIIECQGLTVLADSLLRQIFHNLISNSQKHGEKVSKIRIYYQEKQEGLELIYEDNGVGISKAEKEKIFEEGYGKGSGYGLFLIRKMCEVYGWTIEEKGKQGKGARFIITIPKTTKEGKESYRCNRVHS